MNLIQNRLKTALIIVATLVIVVCSWFPPIQSVAEAQVDAGLKRALISFASARTLNAVISVIQGTEVSMQPLGVGVTLTLGQALDPINDLVEQFSSLMLFASIAFGVQKALLAVGANWVVSLLVSATAIGWAALFYLKKSPPWFTRFLIVLLMIRFAIPVVTIGSDLLYQQLLAEDYAQHQTSIDAVSGEIAKSVPNMPTKGSAESTENSVRPSGQTQPATSAEVQAAAATDKGFFGNMVDKLRPGGSNAEAPSNGTEAPSDIPQKGWFSGLRDRLYSAMPNVSLNYDAIKKTLETLPERIVKVIVIFLLQTMIIPILLLWALYRVALSVARPAARGTDTNQTPT